MGRGTPEKRSLHFIVTRLGRISAKVVLDEILKALVDFLEDLIAHPVAIATKP